MAKKKYEKPAVKKVKLMIEETVLSQCKTSSAALGRGTRTCGATNCRARYGS